MTAQIFPEMFRFTNMVVMLVIFLVHLFLQFMLFPVMIGLWLLVPAMMIVAGLIFSHYAVVVNDIATEDKDELPRPLRDFSWHDDLWGPFVHFATAAMNFFRSVGDSIMVAGFGAIVLSGLGVHGGTDISLDAASFADERAAGQLTTVFMWFFIATAIGLGLSSLALWRRSARESMDSTSV